MKKQHRAPNPLRKWANRIDSLFVVEHHGAILTFAQPAGSNPLFFIERKSLAKDIERVLSKALWEAKR